MATWNWKQGIGNVETAKQQAMEQIEARESITQVDPSQTIQKFQFNFPLFFSHGMGLKIKKLRNKIYPIESLLLYVEFCSVVHNRNQN
jgi:hypothetical protein